MPSASPTMPAEEDPAEHVERRLARRSGAPGQRQVDADDERHEPEAREHPLLHARPACASRP